MSQLQSKVPTLLCLLFRMAVVCSEDRIRKNTFHFIPHPFLLISDSFRIWNSWQETVTNLGVFHSCPTKQHSILISPMGLIFFIKDSFYDFALMKSRNYDDKKTVSDKNTARVEEIPKGTHEVSVRCFEMVKPSQKLHSFFRTPIDCSSYCSAAPSLAPSHSSSL